MIPVYQTKFGKPDGNCFAASLASILEVRITDIPAFPADESWWEQFKAFVEESHGLKPWELVPEDSRVPDDMPIPPDYPWPDTDDYLLAAGMAERGLLHSVVWWRDRMVHDPHPSGAGLVGRPISLIQLAPVGLDLSKERV